MHLYVLLGQSDATSYTRSIPKTVSNRTKYSMNFLQYYLRHRSCSQVASAYQEESYVKLRYLSCLFYALCSVQAIIASLTQLASIRFYQSTAYCTHYLSHHHIKLKSNHLNFTSSSNVTLHYITQTSQIK